MVASTFRPPLITTRTFHTIAQVGTLAYTAAPTAVNLTYAPPSSVINTYDRYVMRKIKVHLIPSGTVNNNGAVAVAYDPTGITGVYNDTLQTIGINNSLIAEVSKEVPRIITYVIDKPGNAVVNDTLQYNPIGTGSGWVAGSLLIASLNLVQNFTVWIEYELDLIAPRIL